MPGYPYFASPLIFQDDSGLPLTLVTDLLYSSPALGMGMVTIPAGFKTDLASIPRVLWVALPPIGRYDKAAVVHDFLYQRNPLGVDRALADRVLLEAMEVSGVSWLVRRTIYAGVRAGGWVPWRKYRSRDHGYSTNQDVA